MSTLRVDNIDDRAGTGLPDAGQVGVGQTWQNVAASRAVNTTYTNTTGRPIQVMVTISAAATVAVTFLLDGNTVAATNVLSNLPQTVTAIVPNNGTYRVNTTSTILYWWELRA